MAIDSETVFGRFAEMVEEHFDIDRDGSTNVLHLHRRTSERESATLILLDGHPESGYFYTPEDVRNSVTSWSPTEEVLHITKFTLGHPKSFYNADAFWALLQEAGGTWK